MERWLTAGIVGPPRMACISIATSSHRMCQMWLSSAPKCQPSTTFWRMLCKPSGCANYWRARWRFRHLVLWTKSLSTKELGSVLGCHPCLPVPAFGSYTWWSIMTTFWWYMKEARFRKMPNCFGEILMPYTAADYRSLFTSSRSQWQKSCRWLWPPATTSYRSCRL